MKTWDWRDYDDGDWMLFADDWPQGWVGRADTKGGQICWLGTGINSLDEGIVYETIEQAKHDCESWERYTAAHCRVAA